ncbi:MAG: DinB family protein, partial [Desulfobacterales bacterium]
MKPSFRKKIDAINGSLEKLLTELAAYSHSQLNTKPAPGKWSAMQTMHHVMTAEQLSIGYVFKKIKYRDNLKKPGMSNALRKM